MAGVFLSYRRKDSGPWTARLHERLALRFGEDLVWRDVDDIRVGRDYLSQIRAGVKAAAAVLVVIGPRWLTGRADRLHNRGDVLRREIEWALSGRAKVIPVLVGDGHMPDSAALPASIATLRDQQAQAVRDGSWDADCTALLEGLRGILRSTRRPVPLHSLHRKLVERESRYFELLPADPGAALALATATLHLLDEQAPLYPQDAFLQNCRGYAHKNVAMALRDVARPRERARQVNAALDRAAAVFGAIHTEAAERLAEALNGLGSVEVVRGRYREGLARIDAALALVPDYPAALQDRALVLRLLGPAAATSSRRHLRVAKESRQGRPARARTSLA
jgi:tetratricopeptide (TPR) repeat protein